MSARAIWQGTLGIQKQEIDVKLFSAVVDRQIHFHLLHKRDRTRVQQRMVDAETEKAVPLEEARKAFEAERGVFVAISREEIEQTAPEPSRKITVDRFVPGSGIDPQFFDRPYYLGPSDGSTADYFALAQALEKKKKAGIALWVMRKHSYVGALIAQQGYLMLITLRHAEEVIPVGELEAPAGRALEPKERELANQLIDALSGDFQPEQYHDAYQERVHDLIEAKRSGKKLLRKQQPRKKPEGTLADSLRASLKNAAAKKRA